MATSDHTIKDSRHSQFGWDGDIISPQAVYGVQRPREHVDNDANFAGICRSESCRAWRQANAFLVSISQPARLGAGIVINGVLAHGVDWPAGEIGLYPCRFRCWCYLFVKWQPRLPS